MKLKKKRKYDWFDWANLVFMFLLVIVMTYPYWNQIVLAFNDGMDSMYGGVYLWPRKFTTANFKLLMANNDIWRAAALTILNVVTYTVSHLLVTTAAAYALTKKDLPYRNAIITFFMIPMYIGGGEIANLILYRYLGLLNTQYVYWVPFMFAFSNAVIIRTFIQGLPVSLEEAAIIDGANEVTVMFRIILPLCTPVLATVALWLVVGSWNNYMTSLYYITDKRLYSLQYVIMQIIKKNEIMQAVSQENAMMGATEDLNYVPTTEAMKSAAIVFSTLPIIMAYPFLQKYFVQGITVGAIKD